MVVPLLSRLVSALDSAFRRKSGIKLLIFARKVMTESIAPYELILERARADGRDVLVETESLALISSLGLAVPITRVVHNPDEAAVADLSVFPGDRIVVKVLSPQIPHKSDLGGVRVVPKKRAALVAAVVDMAANFAEYPVVGWSLNEHIEHDPTPGGEILIGVRHTPDFGPVVALAPGGIYAEHLTRNLRPGRELALLTPTLHGSGLPITDLEEILRDKALTALITEGLRGQRPRLALPELRRLLELFLDLARWAVPTRIAELEINPLALTAHRGPIALDAFVRLGQGPQKKMPPRPLQKIEQLLRPSSIAVIGVSRRQLNPGRLILRNIVQSGFPPNRVTVIKSGNEDIEGCRSVSTVAALPSTVDLLVIAVDASRVPEVLHDVVTHRKATSVILIPGGLGELPGTEGAMESMRQTLKDSRTRQSPEADAWQGPVINGGNCLGVRSVPGRYDTLFIPHHKLTFPEQPPASLAVISQSGAFAIARASKWATLNPRYLITLGNQVDLTVGDYLNFLKDDPEIHVFACYVEGFNPGDGIDFLRAAAEITAAGRPVILYRAGRTAAGTDATASHTASLAGDYTVTRELANAAGVLVTESIEEFEDLVQLFACLGDREVRGRRLGALSNAGFECVAIADNLGDLELAEWSDATRLRLSGILTGHHLSTIVGVRNPLDVTPILDDDGFAEAARAALLDDNVDVALIGCVPLTGQLQTVEAGDGHAEDLDDEDGVIQRLVALRTLTQKAWITVVDSGELFDPMARRLAFHGIPVFRSADRALAALGRFCAFRQRHS